MAALLTTLCHWLLLAWMAALPVHARAQGQPQTCTFHLDADNSTFGQVEGGQVLGIQNTNTSDDQEGTLFRLQGGALYDALSRGCWWASKEAFVLFLPSYLPFPSHPICSPLPGSFPQSLSHPVFPTPTYQTIPNPPSPYRPGQTTNHNQP